MSTHSLALRVITTTFVRRLLRIVGGTVLAILALLWIITIYLSAYVHPAWWLVLIIIVPATIVSLAVLAVLWVVSGKLLPERLTRQQIRQINQFTTKLLGTVESVRLPYPLLLVMIGKDIMRGRPSSFVNETIDATRALKGEYDDIRRMLGEHR